ncbi:MAG TPA: MinD/ParA family protein [Aeromonadales bacterium]|nr:MinD/ParA family protein [Aeromonadales bacterium]
MYVKDQAHGLRQRRMTKPVKVISVTGGKGGVGKSNISVNMAVALAMEGHRVMLLDADLGLANVDVMLGLKVKRNLSHVLNGDCDLEDIIITGPEGMKIIPAASGTKSMAHLSEMEHVGLVRAFSSLSEQVDYLIVDTAAGIADNVISFTLASQDVLMVVCDEPTSITDAYALIKVLSQEHNIYNFKVLANMVRSPQEGRHLFSKLTAVSDRFLDVGLEYLGSVPFDENVRNAIRKQKPFVQTYPRSPAAVAIKQLAKKVDDWPLPSSARGNIEFFMERLVQGAIG